MNKTSQRNMTVDMLRGVAMLMVVWGHTVTACTVDSQNSFLFNLIWALQMPLFMLISGYVTIFSRSKHTVYDLKKYLFRRTISYILPWISWTFVVRGLIFGRYHFFDLKWLLYNMDSGYWFLFSIWTIAVIFGVSQYLAWLITKKECLTDIALTCIFTVVGACVLAGIGLVASLSFLCIKLTLYYIPFYLAGYIYGKVQPFARKCQVYEKAVSVVVVISAALSLACIYRINLYEIEDNMAGIATRAITSLLGCVAICGLMPKLFESVKLKKIKCFLSYVGNRSLEVYVIHGLCLAPAFPQEDIMFGSFNGVVVTIVNFTLTLLVSFFVERIISSNQMANMFLFGKVAKSKTD